MSPNRQIRVWVVIADGEHARVVVPTVSEGQFHTMLAFDSATAHMRSSDLASDAQGRSFESASVSRHAIAPRTDPHAEAKHAFAAEVARVVSEHGQRKEFDQLILVAPPHVLHDLRIALSSETAAKLTGALSKDLVKTKDHDLASHLAAWWHEPPG